jgi:hypothetical protein
MHSGANDDWGQTMIGSITLGLFGRKKHKKKTKNDNFFIYFFSPIFEAYAETF